MKLLIITGLLVYIFAFIVICLDELELIKDETMEKITKPLLVVLCAIQLIMVVAFLHLLLVSLKLI